MMHHGRTYDQINAGRQPLRQKWHQARFFNIDLNIPIQSFLTVKSSSIYAPDSDTGIYLFGGRASFTCPAACVQDDAFLRK
jgi:hypothetical protein